MNPTFTFADVSALSPLISLLGASLLLLLLESFSPSTSKKYASFIALVAITGAAVGVIYAPAGNHPLLTPWLRFDDLGRFFSLLFLSIGFASSLLAAAFFNRFQASEGEYYFLLLSALAGLLLIGTSADFLTLFLGIETLSIGLYILCGYMKKWDLSYEAALKYFFLGSLSAAFFLYGVALIYGATGTTHLMSLLSAYKAIDNSSAEVLFFVGIAFVTLGLAFKATLVPFHNWAPDVYSGVPTPLTAFMAVGTKAGAFAAFARIFLDALPAFDPLWYEGMALLALPTLVYANFVALRQVQLRRFFAYSGISNAGFLLIPIIAGGEGAFSALAFYLTIYSLATLSAFAVLAFIEKDSQGVYLYDLNGLFTRSPLLAGILTLSLMTLAGIPPTVGFLAKFYLFKVAFEASYYVLPIVALLTAILAAFYYMRIVALMLSESPKSLEALGPSKPALVLGIGASAALIVLSIAPNPLLSALQKYLPPTKEIVLTLEPLPRL